MSLLDDLLSDLSAEGDTLRAAVADLDDAGWARPTPAPRWSVATQIGHLAWTDEMATLASAAVTEAGKEAWDEVMVTAIDDPEGFVDAGAEELGALAPEDLLRRWDAGRTNLGSALRVVPDGTRMPWFGPPMSAASMCTARFMETWAHALDVYSALGVTYEPTERVRHVAHLGVRTRDFSYSVHSLTPPSEPFLLELTSPAGETWTWGPEDAAQTVRGTAYDFCLLVTQRVHRDDTDLVAVGADAEHWLGIAQAFAGPAGQGRAAVGG